MVDLEAQLSALGHNGDEMEPSITPFVSKLLVHIRKESAEQREQGRSVSHYCSLSNNESNTKLIGQGRMEAKDMPKRSTRTVADFSMPAKGHSSSSS